MTIVLNTLETGLDSDLMESVLADTDRQVKIIGTSGMRISHCIGCNQCWLKTPGQCVIKDDYEQIVRQLVGAQNLWLMPTLGAFAQAGGQPQVRTVCLGLGMPCPAQ